MFDANQFSTREHIQNELSDIPESAQKEEAIDEAVSLVEDEEWGGYTCAEAAHTVRAEHHLDALKKEVRICAVFDAYTFSSKHEGDYNANTMVFENGKFTALKEHALADYCNAENFVGGGESVDLDVACCPSYLPVVSIYQKIEGGAMNISIASANPPSDEMKAAIEALYSDGPQFEKRFTYSLDFSEYSREDFYINTNDYKGNDFLFSRIDRGMVDELIQKVQEKLAKAS